MTQAETYYRQVNNLSVEEFPYLGDSDMDTIKLMEDFAKEYKKPKRKKKVATAVLFNQRALDIALEFYETLELRDQEKVTPSLFNDWKDCIEKCVRLDKYTYDEVESVLRWTRQHCFWSTNVQSPLKLRKKDNNKTLYVSRLLKEMNADNGGSKIDKVATSAQVLNDVSFAKTREK